MARIRFVTRLKRAWLASKKRGIAGFVSGFTLIELLVSMIIAAIITVSLLSLVIGLVDVNKRDAEQSEVQQSMQAAIDYISEELRESIYVYDDKCLAGQGSMTSAASSDVCPGLVNHIPASLKDNVVLAFWRTNLLPKDVLDICSTYSTGGGTGTDPRLSSDDVQNGYAVKNIPCIAGRGYTLVVYTLQKGSTDVWRGSARLERYQLTQFNADGTKTAGYVDPLNSSELGDLRFQHWPYQKAQNTSVLVNSQAVDFGGIPAAGTPVDTSAVLVDFLDGAAPASAPTCPTLSHPTYNITSVSSPNVATGFHACVRGRTYYNATGLTDAQKEAQEAEQGVKQEIVVNLTGKVPDKPKLLIGLGSAADKKLAPLQTRVLSRSILR